ncbi:MULTISPECIES: type II toxin-antitoxin system VapC family toxin [unclassified Cyanobium]|uniref:type II toxin-antitoxin system VapC family toxin n=1 Tax=unclassified Cyanobium TaxID=2627006 RepID=UPI0020CCBFF9|nr:MULTISPECIES: type II toxin-antitoxin system VapC family toxin [unclassified Cyanobium]MCP9861020.1 type II toxin-antitoxin system VapC family toxin [Cyanobium sp. Cruz-8H5]MCP9868255.1 type II toxin-antitoxin system VapC family toxin [Cyanobium sp. Cruz-8D1]
MLVADTNVLACLFLPTAHTAVVQGLRRQDEDWRLPSLWQSEFRHVLQTYVRADRLSTETSLGLWREAAERLTPREWPMDGGAVLEVAIRSGCSSYDAEFVVLAQGLGCPLLTFDRKPLDLFPTVAIQPSGVAPRN